MKKHCEFYKQTLESIAEQVGGSVNVRYSGRGMHGKICAGIACDDSVRCIELAASQGIVGAKIDELGMQSIIYWPWLNL